MLQTRGSWLEEVLRRPLVGLACAAALGIGLDRLLAPAPWLPLLLSGTLLGGALLVRRTTRRLLPLLVLLLLGCGTLAAALHARTTRAALPVEHVLHHAGERLILAGALTDGPWHAADGQLRYLFAVEQLRAEGPQPVDGGWTPASGTLQLGLATPPDEPLYPGDRLLLRGAVRRPRGFANPGCADFAALLAVRGADGTLFVERPASIVLVARRGGPGQALARWREAVSRTIDQRLGHAPGARELVRGLALGDAGAIPLDVRQAMAATGTAHLIALSGGNLALVVLLAYLLFGRAARLSPRLLLHVRVDRWAAVGTIAAVGLYTLLTGAQLPTARAALMAAVVLGAGLVDRQRDLASGFALAALLLLANRPAALFDPSFQLSFLAVAALLLGVPRLLQPFAGWRPPPGERWWRGRALRWRAVEAVAVAVAAWLGTAPVIAHHFQQFSAISPLANLLVVPLVGLLLFPLAASLLLVAPLWPAAGGLLAALAGTVADWTIALNVGLADLPGAASAVPAPGPGLYLVTLLGLAGLALATHRRGRLVALGVLLAAAAVWWVPQQLTRRDRASATVTMLDVGQGDAALLRLPGGRFVLVDTGGVEGSRSDLARLALLPPLVQAGVQRLELLILTHPHPDHYLAAAALLAQLPVGRVWLPAGRPDDVEEQAEPFRLLLAELADRGIPVERVDRDRAPLRAGPATLQVLHPPSGGGGLRSNDRSLVLSLRLGAHGLLLAGDLEHPGEQVLLASGAPLRHDVLKVAHHGSRTASGPALLDAVQPRAALFSLGLDNRFAFPHPLVWQEYGGRRIARYRTDRDGALTVELDAAGVTLRPFRRVRGTGE